MSSASKVALAPSFVRELTMMIGVGAFSIIASVASNPVILGISMSIVMTSGFRESASSTPSAPSLAAPTASMPGSVSSICFMTLRMNAESSTMSTLIFLPVISHP